MSLRLTSAAAAASLLLLLGACGDDDTESGDSQTVETPAGDVEVDPSDIDTEAMADADTLEEALDATGLETKASAMQTAMGFEKYEMVDDTTVKIFLEGAEDDATMDCMIANGVVDEDETVIAVYSDGEVNCRES